MLQKSFIRTTLGGLLLLLFAFGITPKITLHSLVAHHKDTHIRTDGSTDQLNKAGFHCDTENLVVTAPFLDYSTGIRLFVPVFFPLRQYAVYSSFHSTEHFIFGLRGPPAASSIG